MMMPIPKSDLQVALLVDRLFVLIIFVVPVWPELLAHLGQGPTDDDAHHLLSHTVHVPGLVRPGHRVLHARANLELGTLFKFQAKFDGLDDFIAEEAKKHTAVDVTFEKKHTAIVCNVS